MPTRFNVTVDVGPLIQISALQRQGMFENLAAAVRDVAMAGVTRWQRAIYAVPGIWEGERRAYAESIQAHQVGPYAWEIVSSYKYVEDIESGRPARDLKAMLNTSLKVRLTKKGKRYLVIPFRHNTPGNTAHAKAMPDHVYAEAKQLAPSRIVGHGIRRSGLRASDPKTQRPLEVRARRYVWGDRLPKGMTPKLAPHHATDIHDSMVRFRESTGGSTYMTFRVMVEGSSKWIVPARPGYYIAKTVSESLQRTAEKEFTAAIGRDMAR